MWSSSAERASSSSASSGPSFDPASSAAASSSWTRLMHASSSALLLKWVPVLLSDELADPLDRVVRSCVLRHAFVLSPGSTSSCAWGHGSLRHLPWSARHYNRFVAIATVSRPSSEVSTIGRSCASTCSVTVLPVIVRSAAVSMERSMPKTIPRRNALPVRPASHLPRSPDPPDRRWSPGLHAVRQMLTRRIRSLWAGIARSARRAAVRGILRATAPVRGLSSGRRIALVCSAVAAPKRCSAPWLPTIRFVFPSVSIVSTLLFVRAIARTAFVLSAMSSASSRRVRSAATRARNARWPSVARISTSLAPGRAVSRHDGPYLGSSSALPIVVRAAVIAWRISRVPWNLIRANALASCAVFCAWVESCICIWSSTFRLRCSLCPNGFAPTDGGSCACRVSP